MALPATGSIFSESVAPFPETLPVLAVLLFSEKLTPGANEKLIGVL